jgi:Ni/Co efflux regulator RcnB
MKYRMREFIRSSLLSAAMILACSSVMADKPDWAGSGKSSDKKEHRKSERGKGDDLSEVRGGVSVEFRFGSDERRIIRDYYGVEARKGNCPPGLSKKNNGCLPPGQAKKWRYGHPLSVDLRYYDIPYELRIRLPAPPQNHRYVQIAGDILLIAIGSSMVIDAVEDILR